MLKEDFSTISTPIELPPSLWLLLSSAELQSTTLLDGTFLTTTTPLALLRGDSADLEEILSSSFLSGLIPRKEEEVVVDGGGRGDDDGKTKVEGRLNLLSSSAPLSLSAHPPTHTFYRLFGL